MSSSAVAAADPWVSCGVELSSWELFERSMDQLQAAIDAARLAGSTVMSKDSAIVIAQRFGRRLRRLGIRIIPTRMDDSENWVIVFEVTPLFRPFVATRQEFIAVANHFLGYEAMNVGTLVKFVAAVDPGDDVARFTVLELRGDRVLVEDANSTYAIRPTFVYLVCELMPA